MMLLAGKLVIFVPKWSLWKPHGVRVDAGDGRCSPVYDFPLSVFNAVPRSQVSLLSSKLSGDLQPHHQETSRRTSVLLEVIVSCEGQRNVVPRKQSYEIKPKT